MSFVDWQPSTSSALNDSATPTSSAACNSAGVASASVVSTASMVAIDGVKMSPATVLTKLNEIGGKHGIGRLDKVENRYVGMKSRGCYETPGGTILLSGHRAIESITLDREVLALKDDLMPRYARMIYNGYWFSPERELLQGLIDASQTTVNGTVKLKLYKGTILVVGRESKTDSLFDAKISTFDDDGGAYNQADAAGFIKLNALRLRQGFSLAEFSERTGLAITAIQTGLQEAERKGLIERDFQRVWPTERGFDFLSDLQTLFLSEAVV